MLWRNSAYLRWTILLVLFLVNYVALVGHFPITRWDESRLAVSALEMMESGNYFTPTFQGQADLWNTKPPLLIALQSISFSTFGISEWSFRLPSLLAILLLILMIHRFCKVQFGNGEAGFMASAVLLATPGFYSEHVALTGDYDMLLMLFVSVYAFYLLNYIKTNNRADLIGVTVGVAGAFMTKGIAGGMMLFALVLSIIMLYGLRSVVQPRIVVAMLSGLSIPAIYYAYRMSVSPDYLQVILENEITGRFGGAIEGHQHSFFFYLERLFTRYMGVWLAAAFLIAAIMRKNLGTPAPVRALLLTSGMFLLIISMAQTKLPWYVSQVYPFLAILVGFIFHQFTQHQKMKKYALWFFSLLLIGHVILLHVERRSLEAKLLSYKDYVLTGLLYDSAFQADGITFLEQGYYPQNYFYAAKRKQQGETLQYTQNVASIRYPKVMLWQPELLKQVKKRHVVTSVEKQEDVYIITLKQNGN